MVTTPVPGITLSRPRQVMPGPGLPKDIRIFPSNNNLDLVLHDGALFFAFRSAPTHLASPATPFYLVRSDDGGKTWSLEAKIKRGRDVREPRFLSWGGKLFFYFFEAFG